MSFFDIAVRENGQKILYSWFNALRSAGILIEQFLGTGFLGETEFTVANNQSSAANVTSLVFDKDVSTSAIISVEIRRSTDSTESVSIGQLKCFYRKSTTDWDIVDEISGDDDGVDFTITSVGQIQYTSDNMSGSDYVGLMKFKALTFSA